MMSAVKVSLSNRNEIPLPATSLSTKQLCPGDDRSYTYISRMRGFCMSCEACGNDIAFCVYVVFVETNIPVISECGG